MNKVIDGRRYNTETAKLVATYSDKCMPRNDFRFYDEYLYVKRTGEYFLYGVGNCGSKYNKFLKDYNCYTSSEKIIPLTRDQAKNYINKYSKEECNFEWIVH